MSIIKFLLTILLIGGCALIIAIPFYGIYRLLRLLLNRYHWSTWELKSPPKALDDKLARAVELGKIEEVKKLIEAGANVNFLNVKPYPAFYLFDVLGLAIDNMDNELIKFILYNNFDAKNVQAHLEYWVAIYGCDDTNALLLEYSESISNEVIAQIILFSEIGDQNKCNKHLQIIASRCTSSSEDLERQKLLDRVKEILNR